MMSSDIYVWLDTVLYIMAYPFGGTKCIYFLFGVTSQVQNVTGLNDTNKKALDIRTFVLYVPLEGSSSIMRLRFRKRPTRKVYRSRIQTIGKSDHRR